MSYFHPTALASTSSSSYTPHFFRNIGAATPEHVAYVSASECDDPYMVCPGEAAPPSPPVDTNYCLFSLCVIAAPPSPPAPPLPPPSPQPSPPPPPGAPLTAAAASSSSSTDGLTGAGKAGIAVAAAVAAILLVVVCVLVMKEKAGAPIFTNLDKATVVTASRAPPA